jgi:GTP-binding protein
MSFRREPHKPRGGPDGGNGGRGGRVVLRVDPTVEDLSYFRTKGHFRARSGGNGEGANKDGRSGEDVVILVPPDTRVFRDDVEIARVYEGDEPIQVARGGNGGTGNRAFRSSTNQAPRKTTPGERGEAAWLTLEFRLPVAAALVGLPNSGKSGLLRALTGAPATVAAYPQSTRQPELGILLDEDGERWLLADLPGLDDAGLPRTPSFLGQLERADVIVHCVDATDPRDPQERLAMIRDGIAEYRSDEGSEIVVATACPPDELPGWADLAADVPEGTGDVQAVKEAILRELIGRA